MTHDGGNPVRHRRRANTEPRRKAPRRRGHPIAGALPRIGPNEALVFEIELLAIKPDAPEPAKP